jgi:limonene 1,2-monooxygenase
MFGIETTTQRDRMVEGLEVVIRLFTEEGAITLDGSYFKLCDAHLQVKPYQKPYMPIFVANSISPSGMVAAGRVGCGVLSVAAFTPNGLTDLPKRWEICEETAAEHGKIVDRKDWRLVFPVHLAESKKEALDDVREGGNAWIQEYIVGTLGANVQFEEYPGQPAEEMTVDRLVGRGGAIVGTPDDAIKRVREIWEASGGGFGGILFLAHEWTSTEKTRRSYELWQRYVAPQFQQSIEPIQYSQRWTSMRKADLFGGAVRAIAKATEDYQHHRDKAGMKPAEVLSRPISRIRP